MKWAAAGFLLIIGAGLAFAQAGAEKTVGLAGAAYSNQQPPTISHVYSVLRASQIKHWADFEVDDPEYVVRPYGLTSLKHLDLRGVIRVNNIYGTRIEIVNDREVVQNISFTDQSYVHSIRVGDRIIMDADSYEEGTPIWGDVAEIIAVLGAGAADVVIISPQQDLAVEPSHKPFDTRVAGVISTAPKMLLGGDAGKDRQPLALAGVVPCKVSAENGPIAPGDLLVTASLSGHAMRADPQVIKPGMLVGRALQPLTQGTGRIEILINQ